MMYRFEEIVRKRVVSQSCAAGCGRRVRRTVTARQTINPFNLVADGSRPKDRSEVVASVMADLDAKCSGALVCSACGEAVGLRKDGAR